MGDIVNLHNQVRANAGLPGLTIDPGMNAHAQFHADRMATMGGNPCLIAHSSQTELSTWYAGKYSAENVACIGPCPSDGAGFQKSWMDSPPHRANILNGRYAFVGVGITCDGPAMFAVVHFRS